VFLALPKGISSGRGPSTRAKGGKGVRDTSSRADFLLSFSLYQAFGSTRRSSGKLRQASHIPFFDQTAQADQIFFSPALRRAPHG